MAGEVLDFRGAVALAWQIVRAGYAVEAISCRDDGRYTGWYILFLGGKYDSRVYGVASEGEWIMWQGRHRQRR
jgi:hypothetical protein